MSNFSCFKATKTLILNLLIMIVLLSGCKSRPYVYFSSTPDIKNLKKEKKNIFVQLQLSSENSVDNTLKVINKRKNSITVMPNNIKLTIEDAGTNISVNANYYTLINKRKKRSLSLCKNVSASYSCVDMVHDFYTGRNSKGFKFGTIASKSQNEGYLAFNLPDALCRQTIVKRYKDFFEAVNPINDVVLVIEVNTKRGPVAFEFPVKLQVFYDINEVPISKKQY